LKAQGALQGWRLIFIWRKKFFQLASGVMFQQRKEKKINLSFPSIKVSHPAGNPPLMKKGSYPREA